MPGELKVSFVQYTLYGSLRNSLVTAFRTGDPPVVRELFRMMKEMLQAKFIGFPVPDLRKQMESEFGVILDD